ncbi:glycosyltransferase family 4 protein [Candidatus Beckwithbacteria bacterium]|nr:glycosyltransferase family 4 protein [Candidatus Beckwithbacteria bacterium]
MFIGIDGNEANLENRVGSNIYAYEILWQLYHLTKENKDLKFKIYLKEYFQTDFPKVDQAWNYEIFGPSILWTQWRLPLKLYQEKLGKSLPSLFFTPGHYAPRFSPIPTVVSIMDLAFLKFPNEFLSKDLNQLVAWTKYSVKNAKHIFAISEATKKDIIENYQITEDKITVTYLGFDYKKLEHDEQDESFQKFAINFDLQSKYLLYIGTLQPRKNLIRLIEAFAQMKKSEDYRKLKLIIVGKKGWLYENIFAKVKELGLSKEIIFTGFVSEYEKIQLLKHAYCLVLPSLYEGFGIPVLEAMTLGVLVLASHVSSLPEIGGEAIAYIEKPQSTENIYQSLIKMLQLTEDKRKDLIFKGKKQAQKISWEKCGKQTLET